MGQGWRPVNNIIFIYAISALLVAIALQELGGFMKRQVTIDTVKSRVNELERYMADGVISLGEEFELACLRRMLELEARCAALAAENAGLNEKVNKLATWPGIEFYSSAWEFNNGDGNAALEYMCDTETPATDAFLAEVRAQGVEMFGQWLRDSADIFDKNSRHDWADQNRVSADKAGEFAEHLRKGVQS